MPLIYLADTVHALGQLNPDTVPYNVARIAAYAQQQFPDHDYRLFKDPHALLEALRATRPDILALSHYFWNTRLNHRIARYARSLYPDIVIVTGGPNLDRNRDAYLGYATAHPYVDFVIVEEGETAFANIIRTLAADPGNAKHADIPGTFAILAPSSIKLSKSMPRVRSLDEFPSPYLNGMLNPFLAMGLRPILETVRGCPYECAFCEQGSEFFTKIARLSENRVFAEIEYIRERASASQLILADVNFGILKRDLDVAKFIKASHVEYHWPKSLYVYNAKLPTETTLRTMETLHPMAQLCMSFQSTDEKVLDNIHRANIGYDKYSAITKWAKTRGIPVGTELIYGLPGETRQSFVDGYETLLELRADYMASYNLRVFPGIELNLPAKREEYAIETRFRPMDVNLGQYQFEKPERIMEIEEVVFASSTATEDDFFYTRKLAFMVEVLWNTGCLRSALAFLGIHGFKITDVLQRILTEGSASTAAPFFEEYDRLAHEELVTDSGEFERRCKDADYWGDLTSGRGANMKLNLAFSGRLLLFTNAFDAFLFEFMRKTYGPELSSEDQGIFDDILAHCRASKVDLDDPAPRQLQMSFDVPGWIKATYPADLSPFVLDTPTTYTYSLNSNVLQLAMKTEARLERQGANLNNIAERIYFELPSVYRGTRPAAPLRRDGAFDPIADGLAERVGWVS
jgi:radical SAM superfamily enzyme YgiQ (UPF0313 family)